MLLLSRFGMSRAGKVIIPTGAGPSTLVVGDPIAGFFGEVTSGELITGSALMATIGLTVGTLLVDDIVWLKFSLDGKILFVPKTNVASSASWTSIYQAGAVYGDDTYGAFPSGTARLQNTIVTINKNKYKVRLLTGAFGDNVGTTTGNNPASSQGSEWNRLIYPLGVSTSPISGYAGPYWGLYTFTQLDTVTRLTWCKEMFGSGSTISANRVMRGKPTPANLTKWGYAGGYPEYCWRPCLELL